MTNRENIPCGREFVSSCICCCLFAAFTAQLLSTWSLQPNAERAHPPRHWRYKNQMVRCNAPSTDSCRFLEWQAVALEHSARKAGQQDPFTILWACNDSSLAERSKQLVSDSFFHINYAVHPRSGDRYPGALPRETMHLHTTFALLMDGYAQVTIKLHLSPIGSPSVSLKASGSRFLIPT